MNKEQELNKMQFLKEMTENLAEIEGFISQRDDALDASTQEEIASMQAKEMNADNDTYKILEWFVEQPDIKKLFDDPLEIDAEKYLEIIEFLEKNGFYELMLMLLIKCRYVIGIEAAIGKLAMEKLAKEWGRIGNKQMCLEIKAKIKYEIELSGKENC